MDFAILNIHRLFLGMMSSAIYETMVKQDSASWIAATACSVILFSVGGQDGTEMWGSMITLEMRAVIRCHANVF